MSDLGDLYVDADELAAAQREAMRDAARVLFAPREGDVFKGAGPVPRVVLSPRHSDQTREAARGIFADTPTPSSPLRDRLRGTQET